MSVAQLLGHLRTGDVIIVRGNDASVRSPSSVLGRMGEVGGRTIQSRKLARSLIAVRLDGPKKK